MVTIVIVDWWNSSNSGHRSTALPMPLLENMAAWRPAELRLGEERQQPRLGAQRIERGVPVLDRLGPEAVDIGKVDRAEFDGGSHGVQPPYANNVRRTPRSSRGHTTLNLGAAA
jgi:hypothetical protein